MDLIRVILKWATLLWTYSEHRMIHGNFPHHEGPCIPVAPVAGKPLGMTCCAVRIDDNDSI